MEHLPVELTPRTLLVDLPRATKDICFVLIFLLYILIVFAIIVTYIKYIAE